MSKEAQLRQELHDLLLFGTVNETPESIELSIDSLIRSKKQAYGNLLTTEGALVLLVKEIGESPTMSKAKKEKAKAQTGDEQQTKEPAKPMTDEEWSKYPSTEGLVGTSVDVDNFLDIDTVCDEEILITDVADREGEYGDYRTIVAKRRSGEVIGFNTGSKVLLKQLDRIKDRLPVRATIIKKKRYYTLA